MNLAGFAVRNLLHRPARSLLAGTAIAMAVAGFVALTGLSHGIERAFVEAYVQRGSHVLAVKSGTVEIMTASLDEAMAAELARVPGVSAAVAELCDLVETAQGDHVLVAGWPPGTYLWDTVRVTGGRLPRRDEPDGVILGEMAADALGARVGGRVMIGHHDFLVTGVFAPGGVLSGMMAAVALPTLQRLLGREGRVSLFNLRVERPEDADAVAATRRRLTEAFPSLRFGLAADLGRDNSPFRMVDAATWSTATVAVLLALLVVANTLLLAVIERRRDIGVLTAVGWSAPRIMAVVVLEGTVLSCLAGAAGAFVGSATLAWLSTTPALRGLVVADPGRLDVAATLAVIFVLGSGGSCYPAWRATRVPPVDALR